MENDRNTLKAAFSLPVRNSLPPHWYSHIAKRLLDVLASALGLLLLAPFFAVIGFLVRRDSPGPVFYRGLRLGRGGRRFHILKFRTMREEPASYAGPGVTAQDDPRVTPLGRWLRDTKLNELPQLWNVLRGEMSLVGPRPEDPAIAATWPEAVRAEVLSVRPGITSPASVAYHDEERRLQSSRVMDDYMGSILPDKLRMDQLYVRHHTFLADLDALFWTFVILIPRLGERRIPEGWLFGGPLTRLLRRFLSWIAVDFLIAFLCIGLTGLAWRLHAPLDLGLWRALSLALLLALLFALFNILLGLKNVSWSRAAAEDVLRLIVSCGLVTITVVLLQAVFLPQPGLPASFMYLAGTLVLAGFVAVRYRLRLVTGLASRWISLRGGGYGAGERVLLVGAGEGGEFAAWLLRRPDFRRLYSVVGIVDDDPAKQGMRFDGHKVLGTAADIPELVKRHDVGLIFFSIARISPDDNWRILDICHKTGLPVIMLSEMLKLLHKQLLRTAALSNAEGIESIEPVPAPDELEQVVA